MITYVRERLTSNIENIGHINSNIDKLVETRGDISNNINKLQASVQHQTDKLNMLLDKLNNIQTGGTDETTQEQSVNSTSKENKSKFNKEKDSPDNTSDFVVVEKSSDDNSESGETEETEETEEVDPDITVDILELSESNLLNNSSDEDNIDNMSISDENNFDSEPSQLDEGSDNKLQTSHSKSNYSDIASISSLSE
jgi:hypothetical protein